MTLEQRIAQLERTRCCGKPKYYNTFEDFPIPGVENTLYVDEETATIYIWDGTEYIQTGVPASITGFDTMAAATLALGLGRFFYYNEANLDGATPGSLHITI